MTENLKVEFPSQSNNIHPHLSELTTVETTPSTSSTADPSINGVSSKFAFDSGGDEKIPMLEVHNEMITSLKGVMPEPLIQKLIVEADKNKDGNITADEFFRLFDKDGDGKIPMLEIRNEMVKSLKGVMPEPVIRKLINEADRNKDGYITADEFIKLVKSDLGKKMLMSVWLNSYVNKVVGRKKRPQSFAYVKYGRQTGNANNIQVCNYTDYTDGEYEEEYSCCPPPILMISMSIIQISLFVYDSLSDGDVLTNPLAKVLIFNPNKKIEVWRFLTYMFVHAGWNHLLMNVSIQILLALPLEMVHGWWRVLAVYLMGVISGALGTSISSPRTYLAGASGGVYSVITAHLAVISLNWAEMSTAKLQLIIFSIFMLTDTGYAIYETHILNLNSQVGYVSHFCGALAGFLFGVCMLRNLEVHPWERKFKFCSWIIFSVLIFGAIIWTSLI